MNELKLRASLISLYLMCSFSVFSCEVDGSSSFLIGYSSRYVYLSVMSKFLLLSSTFALECMRMGALRDFMYSCASCFVSVFALQVWFSTTDPKKEVFLTAKLQNTFRTTGAA